jgi:phosphatidate cytidylyltransferase
MKDLQKRLITAIILIVLYLGLLTLADSSEPLCNLFAVLVFAALGMIISLEFSDLSVLALRSDYYRWPAFICCIIPLLSVLYSIIFHGQTLHSNVLFIFLGLIISVLSVFALAFYKGRYEIAVAVEIIRFIMPAILLIGLGTASLCALIYMRNCFNILIWITLTVALNDSAAYFAGSRLGRTPLAPSISPKKSVEGSVAGIIVGALAGVATFKLIALLPWYCALFFCVGIVIAAQTGDLIKSFIKRLAGTKDSANWLPGHGGLFDRADALLATSPILLIFLAIYNGF